ncbi:hypothetical protein X975_04104, partial [Stegodyphus mimosarum]
MKDPCLKYACELQKCLKTHNYNEEMCSTVMKALLDCCQIWKTEAKCCLGFIKTNDSNQ